MDTCHCTGHINGFLKAVSLCALSHGRDLRRTVRDRCRDVSIYRNALHRTKKEKSLPGNLNRTANTLLTRINEYEIIRLSEQLICSGGFFFLL